jgi:Flp pilus assembly protein TadG
MTRKVKEMDISSRNSGLLGRIRAFSRDNKGVAAIEFAFVVPIMIGFYFMLNETANGMRAARKVTMVARVMADLASRPANVSDGDLSDIFSAGAPIMAPFSTAERGYRITSIRFKPDDGTGIVKGFVDWSITDGAVFSAYARCTPSQSIPNSPVPPISVPTGLQAHNSSLVLAEVAVPYRPAVGWNITGTLDLRDKLFMRPRLTDFVTYNGITNPVCP